MSKCDHFTWVPLKFMPERTILHGGLSQYQQLQQLQDILKPLSYPHCSQAIAYLVKSRGKEISMQLTSFASYKGGGPPAGIMYFLSPGVCPQPSPCLDGRQQFIMVIFEWIVLRLSWESRNASNAIMHH